MYIVVCLFVVDLASRDAEHEAVEQCAIDGCKRLVAVWNLGRERTGCSIAQLCKGGRGVCCALVGELDGQGEKVADFDAKLLRLLGGKQ